MTNTIARIRSLQSWARRWNVFVSSPFRTCDSGIRFLRYIYVVKFLAKERFSIAREVCIDMTQYTFIDAEKFNHYILDIGSHIYSDV